MTIFRPWAHKILAQDGRALLSLETMFIADLGLGNVSEDVDLLFELQGLLDKLSDGGFRSLQPAPCLRCKKITVRCPRCSQCICLKDDYTWCEYCAQT